MPGTDNVGPNARMSQKDLANPTPSGVAELRPFYTLLHLQTARFTEGIDPRHKEVGS